MLRLERLLNITALFQEKALKTYVPNGAPDYNPKDFKKTCFFVNCMGYALNLPDHGWAFPGGLKLRSLFTLQSMVRFSDMNADTVDQLINADDIDQLIKSEGLESIDVDLVNKHGVDLGKHIIAAFVEPNKDFHFYRLDSDGRWSSKYGQWFISKEEKIDDVMELEQLSGGLEFVGTYAVPQSGLKYYPRLTLPKLHDRLLQPIKNITANL